MKLEIVFLVLVSKEIYGICKGSLIFASNGPTGKGGLFSHSVYAWTLAA